ncbi:MAG: hypothetical protein EOO28_21690 [Comamonadaceae bacterium]|nr:MAG: hypothetical protein EOO28_21690 [Comamonadaceae bacterium]
MNWLPPRPSRSPGKYLLALALLAITVVSPAAETYWFTIIGDPTDPTVTTVLIDPTPILVKGSTRLMNLRVSRDKPRVSTDGVAFQSFQSTVEFDCEKGAARFTRAQFHDKPLWAGPGRSVDYPPSTVRPMLFRDIEPNPSQRIIKAACVTTGMNGR